MDVLVVSDSKQLRDQVVEYLQEGGFGTVHAVGSPEEARRALRLGDSREPEEDWRGVLIDLKRRDRAALDFCRSCSTELSTRNLPLLAITRNTDPRTLRAIFGAGCEDVVSTPLNGVVLRHRVKRLLADEAGSGGTSPSDEVERLQKQLERLRRRLRRLDGGDERSSLPTEEQFRNRLREEWDRLRRSGRSLSVLLVDVDDFTSYRERYGGEDADGTFLRLARTLQTTLKRPGDRMARFTSADFAVLLPEMDLESARCAGESMRASVKELGIEHFDAPRDYLSVSLGASSTVPSGETSPEALLEHARDALEEARRGGGDRLVAIPIP